MSPLIATALIALPVSATAAPATAPTSAPTSARTTRTDHDLLREIAAFDQKFVVDAYAQVGHHDPKWDEAATKLVKAQYEASIVNSGFEGYYAPRDRPAATEIDERVKLANAVVEAGCDDAMALFMAACALEESPSFEKHCAEAYARASANVAESKYVPIYKMLITTEAMKHSDNQLTASDPDFVDSRKAFRGYLKQVLADKQTLPAWRSVVWAKGEYVFNSADEEAVERIATAMADVTDADPWLWDTYMGAAEIRRAWHARGSGWADSVTADGWKIFAEHLKLAREHLERASALDTALPHPAALMITVAMGQSASDAEKWFKEAIRRQIDYPMAYAAYRSVVQPRWGGSIAQQLELARSQVDTGRFDTRVPQLAMDIADDMEDDAGHALDVDELSQIASLVDRAMAGYAAADQPEHVRNWANATRVTWLCLTKRWKEARAVLDTMPQIENAPATYRDLEGGELIGLVFAMTSPQADAISAAMEESDAAARLAQLKAIAADITDDDEAAKSIEPKRAKSAEHWLARRIAETEFAATLVPGEWKPLPIDPDLTGWRADAGEWQADGPNALLGTAAHGLNIVAPVALPERYEFRCTLEVVGDAAPNQKYVYVFPAWSPKHRFGADAMLSEGHGYLIYRGYNYGAFPLETEGDRTTLHFRYDRGQFAVLDESGDAVATLSQPPGSVRRLAFGGTDQGGPITWRFSDIAVRTLKTPEKRRR